MNFKPGTGFVSSNYMVDKKKLNPFRVHFMRLFFPTLASEVSQRGAFKSTTRTELPFRLSPVILSHSYYDETIGWRLPHDMV